MVDVKNGEFLNVNKRAFKANSNSVYFYKRLDHFYDCIGKKVNCNYSLFRMKGKKKSERTNIDNIEKVRTIFNILKSPDFNFTNLNYENSEVLEIKLLEADQPLWGDTKLIFEVNFIDIKDKIYSKREYVYIPSFNGTQEKRIQYYKEFFDKYCYDYLEKISKMSIPDIEILRVVYKEIFSPDVNCCKYNSLNAECLLATRIFGIINSFDCCTKDFYFRLYIDLDSEENRSFLNRYNLNNKYKKQIDKIFKVVKSQKCSEILRLYKNSRHDKMPEFLKQINNLIKENKL